MSEVFEKIIRELSEKRDEAEKNMELSDVNAYGGMTEGFEKAIEIMKRVVEEHATDTNAGNNGWIECNERMPDVTEGMEDEDCPEFNVTIKGAKIATTLKCAPDGTWFDELGNIYKVIAWQPLPEAFQPKGE